MKNYFVVAAFALAAGCASNNTTAVDTTGYDGPQTAQIAPGSQADLEQYAGHMVFFGYDQYTLDIASAVCASPSG